MEELTYQQDCLLQGKGFIGFCGQSWQQTQTYKFIFIGLVVFLIAIIGLLVWKKYRKRL